MRNLTLKTRQSQRGYLIIVAMIIMVVVGFTATILTEIFVGSTRASASHVLSDQALNLAESGLEHITHKLLSPTVALRSPCASLPSSPITNSFGPGAYLITASSGPLYSSNATTLTNLIGATDTTIAVASTTGYAPMGKIMIESESLNYAAITATSFNNVTRGVDGSSAASHPANAPVGQYQCNVVASGGVPNLTTPVGKRTVSSGVELQEAITVGDATTSGNYTVGRWNNPTEDVWTNPNFTNGSNLLGVSLLNYADGWIVGNAGAAYKWNGKTTITKAYTLNPNVNYNSVYCTGTNVCHAVGNNYTSYVIIVLPTTSLVIQDWNGTSWSQSSIGGNTAANNLYSVNCSSSSDCWAVGDNAKSNVFYHYTNAWSGIAQTTVTSFPYRGVFCNSPTDCWAVGATGTFARLTSGTNWTNVSTGVTGVYNSVYCNSTNDCWAVGNITGGNDLMMHYTNGGMVS